MEYISRPTSYSIQICCWSQRHTNRSSMQLRPPPKFVLILVELNNWSELMRVTIPFDDDNQQHKVIPSSGYQKKKKKQGS